MADNLIVVTFPRRVEDSAAAEGTREPLKGGGGDDTLPPMVPLKDYVDKADEAVETRLNAKLDGLATSKAVWGAAVSLFLGLLAVLAFAGDRFDAGLSTSDARQEQLARDNAQDASMADISNKLDLIIAGQRSTQPAK